MLYNVQNRLTTIYVHHKLKNTNSYAFKLNDWKIMPTW